jgi:PhoH-like ATPase
MLILGAASQLASSGKYGKVSLISKDVNLRVLADIEGLIAEDYEPDRVSFNELYTGYRVVEEFDASAVAMVYTPSEVLRPEMLGLDGLHPKEFVILRDPQQEILLRYDDVADRLLPVPHEFGRLDTIQPRNIEQRMALSLLLDPEVELVTMVGKAGTGKTFIALAAALAQLRHGHGGRGYDRILLSKPVVAMGQDLGYLPGDLEAKMQPWMNSFFDNLDQLIKSGDEAAHKGANRSTKGWEYLFQTGELEIQPLHSIRGRSIPSAFMFIDEAQNLTPHEVKTVITRAANGTKVVLSGDPYQVDNHFLDQHSNGLVHVTERVRDSRFTGTVFFTRGERSRLSELAATRL